VIQAVHGGVEVGETKIDWPVWHSRSSHFIHNNNRYKYMDKYSIANHLTYLMLTRNGEGRNESLRGFEFRVVFGVRV
jgi:hypothetical protein